MPTDTPQAAGARRETLKHAIHSIVGFRCTFAEAGGLADLILAIESRQQVETARLAERVAALESQIRRLHPSDWRILPPLAERPPTADPGRADHGETEATRDVESSHKPVGASSVQPAPPSSAAPLRPCPFCGGTAEVVGRKFFHGARYMVGCTECDCWYDCRVLTPEDARDSWNRRGRGET